MASMCALIAAGTNAVLCFGPHVLVYMHMDMRARVCALYAHCACAGVLRSLVALFDFSTHRVMEDSWSLWGSACLETGEDGTEAGSASRAAAGPSMVAQDWSIQGQQGGAVRPNPSARRGGHRGHPAVD